jgi:hypothetical protein
MLAKQGHSAQIIAAIRESGATAYLEPLNVALQIIEGKTPMVAKEIVEVANDIVEKIAHPRQIKQ